MKFMVINCREAESEAWFDRTLENSKFFDETWPHNDPISSQIFKLPITNSGSDVNILEVGCGRAIRLKRLSQKYNWNSHGVDISKKSIEVAIKNGVNAILSPSTKLPYSNCYFDIVIIGFCLYMHGLEELFQVFSECDRVLKPKSYLLIQVFYSKYPIEVPYKHQDQSTIIKHQYIDGFLWHPSYTLFCHQLYNHQDLKPTDIASDYVSVSTLRKGQTLAFTYSGHTSQEYI